MRDVRDAVSQFAARMGAERDPLFVVRRVAERYTLRLEGALREHGLAPIGWCLLLRLNERDGDNTTTLASRTTYERSSVVRALEKLERKKLVQRSNHHPDRRNSIVSITGAGRAAFRRAAQSVQRVREDAYAGLTASRLSALEVVLGKIGRNLNGQSRNNARAEKASSVG